MSSLNQSVFPSENNRSFITRFGDTCCSRGMVRTSEGRTDGIVPEMPTQGICISSWKYQTSDLFSFPLWRKAASSMVIWKVIYHHLNQKTETREALGPLFRWCIVLGRFIKCFISVSIFLQHPALFSTCNVGWLLVQGHVVLNVTFLTSAEHFLRSNSCTGLDQRSLRQQLVASALEDGIRTRTAILPRKPQLCGSRTCLCVNTSAC